MLQLHYLQENILLEQDQLKRFMMRLVSDLLFRGDKEVVIFEDLAGVSTFKSRSIMRNYPCSPQYCVQILEVFFPQILMIEKRYPPKWMRWLSRPTYRVVFHQTPATLVSELSHQYLQLENRQVASLPGSENQLL
jgi:hypothetical protein